MEKINIKLRAIAEKDEGYGLKNARTREQTALDWGKDDPVAVGYARQLLKARAILKNMNRRSFTIKIDDTQAVRFNIVRFSGTTFVLSAGLVPLCEREGHTVGLMVKSKMFYYIKPILQDALLIQKQLQLDPTADESPKFTHGLCRKLLTYANANSFVYG